MYRINSIYWTIQGEGQFTGSPCVIVRMSGCNLWSGKEADRASAVCRFCDTDFRVQTVMSAEDILTGVRNLPPAEFVLVTGGEPALQFDLHLLNAFRDHGLRVHLETNGTIPLAARPDWVTVSPKAGTKIIVSPDELKVVLPQEGLDLATLPDCEIRSVQPLHNDPNATAVCVSFIRSNPRWRLSVQTHKLIDTP